MNLNHEVTRQQVPKVPLCEKCGGHLKDRINSYYHKIMVCGVCNIGYTMQYRSIKGEILC